MRRVLASLLIALHVLMPLSAMAGAGASAADSHEMPCHSTGDQPDPNASNLCGDMGGCCAAFLIPAVLAFHSLPGVAPLHFFEIPRAGYAPELVDPPPVVP